MFYIGLASIFAVLSGAFFYLLYKKRLKRLGHFNKIFDFIAISSQRTQTLGLEMLKQKFEIQLTPGREIQIENCSSATTRLVKILLGIRMANPCEYAVKVVRVSWELWLGPVVKMFSCQPDDILLKAKAEVRDYLIQDVIEEQDFVRLALLNEKDRPLGYLEGTLWCQTDFGIFEKKFTGFNLKYHLIGGLGFVVKESQEDAPSNIDILTGFLQRKFIETHLQAIIDTVTQRAPVSFAMVDVDHFKTFNDTYGHLIGDEILRTVGAQIRKVVGGKGLVVRYGGDEFCIIFEGLGVEDAEKIVRKLHREVGESKLRSPQGELKITLSIGIAALTRQADYQILIQKADKALYESKRKGRNQVTSDYDSK